MPANGGVRMNVYEIRDGFGLDKLVLGQRLDPQPGPGEVLLRMRAASLNYRDLLVVKGVYNPRMALPRVPMSDGVGIVEAVGPGVTRVKPGQRVAGAFMPGWSEGELTDQKAKSALGGGVDGLLSERAVLPEDG